MTPQHSSGKHLLCFMFHALGGETVEQAPGARFGSIRALRIARAMQLSQCSWRTAAEQRRLCLSRRVTGKLPSRSESTEVSHATR
jgi:hypothetical protein